MRGSVGSLRWLLFVVLCCFEFCGRVLLLGKAGVCLGCVLVILVLVLLRLVVCVVLGWQVRADCCLFWIG